MNNLQTIKENITAELTNQGIEAILPKHVDLERFMQVFMIAAIKNPAILETDRNSLIMSLVECAKDGLLPDGREAFINVYNKKVGTAQNPNWIKFAQYQAMIEGVLKRARQSGDLCFIECGVVYKGEEFKNYIDQDGRKFFHEPDYGVDRSDENILVFYGIAKIKSTGEVKLETMDLNEIQKARESSKTNGNIWKTWFVPMGKKSVGHRLCRHLPKGHELIAMLEKGDEKVWQDSEPLEVKEQKIEKQLEQKSQLRGLMNRKPEVIEQKVPEQKEKVVSEVKTTAAKQVKPKQQALPQKTEVQQQPKPTQKAKGSSMASRLVQRQQAHAQQGQSKPDSEVFDTLDAALYDVQTKDEYKAAVIEVKQAFSDKDITESEYADLNAKLTTIYQSLTGN